MIVPMRDCACGRARERAQAARASKAIRAKPFLPAQSSCAAVTGDTDPDTATIRSTALAKAARAIPDNGKKKRRGK